MPTRRVSSRKSEETPTKKHRTGTTPEARENQLIAAAYDLAERQITEGSASSQTIVHFLKLGSSREKLEQLRIQGEVELQKAKIELMESHKRIEELYGDALNAMKSYSGQEQPQSRDDRER